MANTFFKNRCFVCRHKFGVKFQFHHLWYLPNEAKYKDFTNPLEYAQHLSTVIREQPDRFMLLCKKHHNAVEISKRFEPDSYKRLLKAVRMTKT